MSANFFIYEFLFSESYQSGIGVVPILLTAIIFSTLMQFFGGIQIALKNTKDNGITTIIGGMINILLNLVFVPSGGIYAAAMTTLIANIVTVLLRRIRLLRYVKFKLDFKAWEAIIYYILIVLFTYVPNLTWILRCGGFLVAMVLFLKVNKDLIKKIVSK
jgi:O-antigen/teichoic acid export membrane protein